MVLNDVDQQVFIIPQCNMSRFFLKQGERAGFRTKIKSLEVSRGWMFQRFHKRELRMGI